MKIKLILALVTFTFLSCEKKVELNKYNFESVKDYAINCIKRNDSIAFMKLFNFESELFKSKFSDGNDEIKNAIEKQFKQVQEIIKDSDFEFIKFDFIDTLVGGELIDKISFNIYFKANNSYYKLRFTSLNRSLENANNFYNFLVTNLTAECREFEIKPYTPTTLNKHELLWDNLGQGKFNYVALRLYNLTIYPVEKVKYNVSITRNSDDMLIFMKTLESKVSLNEGDVGNMVIEELKGVYLGAPLDSDENFSWKVDILDVFPRPLKNPCEKIEILKQTE